jgi:hypothetical protein
MAAATVAKTLNLAWAGKRRKFRKYSCVFDTGDYATGGIAITPAQFGFTSNIDAIIQLTMAGGYVWQYDDATGKLVQYFMDCDAVADSPLIEFTNATPVVTQTELFLLIGT